MKRVCDLDKIAVGIFICLSALLVAACVPQRSSVSTYQLHVRSEDATRAQSMCALEKAGSVDDGISDAQTIAIALSLQCVSEYENATRAYGMANLYNDAQRQMFRDYRNSTKGRVEAFLPAVIKYRSVSKKLPSY